MHLTSLIEKCSLWLSYLVCRIVKEISVYFADKYCAMLGIIVFHCSKL